MSRFLRSSFFKIILVIIFLIFAYRFYTNYRNIKELENTIIELEDTIVLAIEERNNLEEELKNINNPDYIERIAREELGLVKPGELLIIPVEEEDK